MKVKKILVSQPRPAGEKSPYFDLADKYGVDIVFRPFVKVESVPAKEFRASKINLADFTAIIFNSKVAIDNYFRMCEEMRVSVPDTMRYFCTSETVALYLQKYIVYRKRKISFGKTGKLNDPTLLAAIEKNKKENFLLPVSDIQIDETGFFNDKNLNVTPAVMYHTVSNDFGPDEVFDYDLLVFFSPAGIQSLLKNFPDFNQEDRNVYIATFGPSTAKTVEEAGLRLDISAPSVTARSMPEALDQFLSKTNN